MTALGCRHDAEGPLNRRGMNGVLMISITSYMAAHDLSASAVVSQLRAQVESTTSLTISAGIAPNRMLAKICSDMNKPNGQFELAFDRAIITRFMRDLPVRKIPGFGRVTERCLEGLGVERCGQVWEGRAELLAMDHWFGYRNLWYVYEILTSKKDYDATARAARGEAQAE